MHPWWRGRCQSSSCDTRRNACRRNLITGLTSAASPRVHISSTCKVGQKLGEILYLMICSFLPCLSWLLRSRVRKSRRDLWITLYNSCVLSCYNAPMDIFRIGLCKFWFVSLKPEYSYHFFSAIFYFCPVKLWECSAVGKARVSHFWNVFLSVVERNCGNNYLQMFI